MGNKIIDFFRIFCKVISSISIVGVYQGFFHWFTLSNMQEILNYLNSFGKPRVVVLGLLFLVITHYIISFNLLFHDWLPSWKPEEISENTTKEKRK